MKGLLKGNGRVIRQREGLIKGSGTSGISKSVLEEWA